MNKCCGNCAYVNSYHNYTRCLYRQVTVFGFEVCHKWIERKKPSYELRFKKKNGISNEL